MGAGSVPSFSEACKVGRLYCLLLLCPACPTTHAYGAIEAHKSHSHICRPGTCAHHYSASLLTSYMFRSRDSGFTALSQSDDEGDPEESTSLTQEDSGDRTQPRHSRNLSSPPKAPGGSNAKRASAGSGAWSSPSVSRANSLPNSEGSLTGTAPSALSTAVLKPLANRRLNYSLDQEGAWLAT